MKSMEILNLYFLILSQHYADTHTVGRQFNFLDLSASLYW